MECPNCGQENAADARFCLACGTALTSEPPEDAAPEQADLPAAQHGSEEAVMEDERTGIVTEPDQPTDQPTTPAPPGPTSHQEYTLSHRGSHFGVGYGPEFYGVWDLRVGGEPVAKFERTSIGWEAAWRRFQQLDVKHRVAGWRRPNVGLILLHIVIGLVVLGFLQGFLVGGLLLTLGREVDGLADPTALGLTLAAFTGLIGWLLFVYLNRSTAARTLWFVLFLLGGLGAAFAIALANQPLA